MIASKTKAVILLRFAAGLAFLVACACNQEPKQDPLSALDTAYKAGLLTKEEFDAKRAALVAGATPAPAATPAAPPPPASNAPSPVDSASGGGSGGGGDAASTPPAAPAPPATSAPPATPAPPAAPARPAAPAVAKQPPAVKPAVPAAVQTARARVPLPVQPTSALDSAAAPVGAPTPTLPGRVESKEKEEEPTVLAGCEDEQFKSGGQKEASRFYAAPPEQVRNAAVATLNTMGFNIHKNTEKDIEATRQRHLGAVVGAGGEKVTLTLKAATDQGRSGTMVTGETKRSFIGRLAQRTWTDAVLAQMACKLRNGN